MGGWVFLGWLGGGCKLEDIVVLRKAMASFTY